MKEKILQICIAFTQKYNHKKYWNLKKMGIFNKEKIKNFEIENVNRQMEGIYGI